MRDGASEGREENPAGSIQNRKCGCGRVRMCVGVVTGSHGVCRGITGVGVSTGNSPRGVSPWPQHSFWVNTKDGRGTLNQRPSPERHADCQVLPGWGRGVGRQQDWEASSSHLLPEPLTETEDHRLAVPARLQPGFLQTSSRMMKVEGGVFWGKTTFLGQGCSRSFTLLLF